MLCKGKMVLSLVDCLRIGLASVTSQTFLNSTFFLPDIPSKQKCYLTFNTYYYATWQELTFCLERCVAANNRLILLGQKVQGSCSTGKRSVVFRLLKEAVTENGRAETRGFFFPAQWCIFSFRGFVALLQCSHLLLYLAQYNVLQGKMQPFSELLKLLRQE